MIHKVYDLEGNLMYLNDKQLEQYRKTVHVKLKKYKKL